MLISWTFFVDCINTADSQTYFFKDEALEIHKNLNTSLFATGRLILKPYKEKGHQFVNMDTIVSVLFKSFYEMDSVNKRPIWVVGNNIWSWEVCPAPQNKWTLMNCLLKVLCMHIALLCFILNLYVHLLLLCKSCRQDIIMRKIKQDPIPLLNILFFISMGERDCSSAGWFGFLS